MEVSQCWCGGAFETSSHIGHFFRCKSCHSWVNTSPPDHRAEETFYSKKWYWDWVSKARGWPSLIHRGKMYIDDGRLNHWLNAIDKLEVSGKKVVEIGCAPGILLKELSKKGFFCIGVEPSKDVAKWIIEDTGIDIRNGFFPSQELNLPAVDLFLALDVFEHVDRPDLFLKEARNSIVKGGFIIIQSPIELYNDENPFKNRRDVFHDIDHRFIFSEKSIHLLAKKLNLRVVDIDDGWMLGHEMVIFQRDDNDA